MPNVLAAVILAAHCTVHAVIVPDPHTFPHGITLNAGERLAIVQARDVLHEDGFPDLTKIKAALCAK